MYVYTIFTAIALAFLIFIAVDFLINVIKKDREERIAFLRHFKKGNCAVIYFIAIPLYYMGFVYDGYDKLTSIFNAINKVVSCVVLRYDTEPLESLMANNPFFEVTVYVCFVLILINALLFGFSLIQQALWSWAQGIKFNQSKKDKLFIFGYNKENISIYKSEETRMKAIIAKLSKDECADLYMKNVRFFACDHLKKYVDDVFANKKFLNQKNIFVVNLKNDEKNAELCNYFIEEIEQLRKKTAKTDLFSELRIYVFGDPKFEAIYLNLENLSHGCIHYINKYRQIAIDFIDRHPLTKYMDEDQLDFDTSLIRDGVDINAIMIGFGKTNRQIFLTSVANNQFMQKDGEKYTLKKVNYHIFDKEEAQKDKNLNHKYYRFKQEVQAENEKDYLPLPAVPANDQTHCPLDVNDPDFYKTLKKIVTDNPKDRNFIFIGFGTDLENVDMAQKMIEKKEEWGIKNLIVFVKVRDCKITFNIFKRKDCIMIANEKEIVYDIEKIVNDKMTNMAMMRNRIYALEWEMSDGSLKGKQVSEQDAQQIFDQADRDWYLSKTQIERESSLYCCLSLRSKLNMMNLDYCLQKENDLPALSEEEYMRIYAGEDMPNYYPLFVQGKRKVKYPINFAQSRRGVLAEQEHYRWNSYMLTKGMIPATRAQILSEKVMKDGELKYSNGKNYDVRRHGNITTMEGLLEFRKMIAQRDQKSEEQTDVIKFDYQILDDAYWFLTTNGYKIIKKQKQG